MCDEIRMKGRKNETIMEGKRQGELEVTEEGKKGGASEVGKEETKRGDCGGIR